MEENKPESAGSDGEQRQPWIDELCDEQLENFAQEFDAARPELPTASLERISGLVESELSSVQVHRKPQGQAALVGFVAALTLAAVIFVAGFYRPNKQPQPQKATAKSPEQKHMAQSVHDQFVVDFVVLPPEGEQLDSLFPVEQYTSLTGGLDSSPGQVEDNSHDH
jgi:hypothetical protein